jgi:HEAT repeat protein
MAQATAIPTEFVRLSVTLARNLSAAVRNWALYPPEHPAVAASVERLTATLGEVTSDGPFAFGVTPDTLLVAGTPLPSEQPVLDAARYLHDRDILQLSFAGPAPAPVVQTLLRLLTLDAAVVRASGGPAAVWAREGHPGVAIDQIDYEKLLEDREGGVVAGRRDDVWRSLVAGLARGQREFNEEQQRRLLEISYNAGAIGALAADATEPMRNVDGSPLVTTQAATVLAVFRHLAGIVSVMEPERGSEVMRNLADAASTLNPQVVMQMMEMEGPSGDSPLIAGIAGAFDDEKVAKLLATALSRAGQATARLAQVFDTIAPDADRKRRVLTMTRSLLGEQNFGASSQFRAAWSSMETLLLNYDETPYMAAGYQASLDGASARAEMLAARGLPAELPEWLETLGENSVRSLSVVLITDLLRIEENAERAVETIGDMRTLVDDLLLGGDFTNAACVLRELQAAARRDLAGAAARATLTSVGESMSLLEAAALIGDLDEPALAPFSECCELIGATAAQALLPLLKDERHGAAYVRAASILERLGPAVIPHLSSLVDSNDWFVQRNAAALLGAMLHVDAIAPLQALLRKHDARVLHEAVRALAGIDDPAAAHALQSVLRRTAGSNRLAIVNALVAERDRRVVPMVARIISESDPFSDDHRVVIDMLGAVAQLGDDRGVPAVALVMRKTRWFRRTKALGFKRAAVQALIAIGSPDATRALEDATRTGDRLLRRAVMESRR